jgi:methylenetetrahydrofolate reductase (NADPH)
MKIAQKLNGDAPAFSFEFFPPKSADGVERLFQTIADLESFSPAYVSVTYGAGGSTQSLTVDLVRRIQAETGLDAMAHLTCVGATVSELSQVLDQFVAAGIQNILPLRGDPPLGQTGFVPIEGGFSYASELVALTKTRHEFCIAGACYPEGHIEAPNLAADLDHLKMKVDSGVDFLVTQLFFDNQDYFRFLDRARGAGITVPVVAGIMPVTNVAQVKRFTQMCGAKLPPSLLSRLAPHEESPHEESPHEEHQTQVRKIGVEHATRQCEELLEQGCVGVHFYTLNRSLATREILENLRATSS